jgi:16S rRNA (uracil1498-N3)-methyltransferase
LPGPGVLALFLDTGDSPALGTLDVRPEGAVWLAVGPESGFSEDERVRALGGGWRAVGLGPRVLRTETAGIVGAALVLHRWGDLGPMSEGFERS